MPLHQISNPTDQEFTAEILSGVRGADDMDSLDLIELVDALSDVFDEQAPAREPNELDEAEMLEELQGLSELSERDQKMYMLHRFLSAGMEVETTIFGIPVTITPTQPSPEPPTRPDDASGVREPRIPLPPTPSEAVSIEVA